MTIFMLRALELAQKAFELNEVPVGAVVVKDGVIIGEGYNLREQKQQPCAHAEMFALEKAAKSLQTWRLINCEMYVTLEPCVMCAGALHQARVKKVYFGAFDPKAGAMGSLYSVHQDSRLNHQIEVESGVLSEEAASLLKKFFKKLRAE